MPVLRIEPPESEPERSADLSAAAIARLPREAGQDGRAPVTVPPAPQEVPEPRPDTEPTGSTVAASDDAPGRRRRRRHRLAHPVGAAAAILVILFVVAGLLMGPVASNPPLSIHHGADARAAQEAQEIDSLPERVVYILGGADGGLRMAAGSGARARGLAVGGLAARVVQSPDGSRLGVIRKDGSLRVLPGSWELPGPVRDVAFPRDGGVVAACSGRDPHMVVVLVGGEVVWSGPSVPACMPSWSPDGRFVAFTARSGTRRTGVTRVVDMRGGRVLDLPDAGPIAWGPPDAGTGYLATVSRDCRSIVSVDAGTGATATIMKIPGMSGLRTKWGSSCPVSAMAWSPAMGPGWLAVAIRGDDANPGRVLVFAVLARHMFDVRGSEGLITRSLSWSPDGRMLLVDGADHDGTPVTVLAEGPRGWTGERLTMASASWSPDGRWILGRSSLGWAGHEAVNPRLTLGLTVPGSATAAIWCCPPVPSYRAWPSR